MSYILDPGSDANSYTDAVSRPWRDTAGLWKVAGSSGLAAEVALYNASQAALAAETAAYNTAVAHQAMSGVPNYDVGLGGTVPSGGSWVQVAATTAARNGYYAISAEATVGGRSGGSYNAGAIGTLRILVGGSVGATGVGGGCAPDGNTPTTAISCWYLAGPLPAGMSITAQGSLSDGGGITRGFSGTLHVRFIPEYSYPS